MKRRIYLVAAIVVAVYVALSITIRVLSDFTVFPDVSTILRTTNQFLAAIMIPSMLILVGIYQMDEFGDRLVFGILIAMSGLFTVFYLFIYIFLPVFFRSTVWIEHWNSVYFFQNGLLAIIMAGYVAVGLLLLLKVRIKPVSMKIFAWASIITGTIALMGNLNVLFGSPFNSTHYALVEYKYIPITALIGKFLGFAPYYLFLLLYIAFILVFLYARKAKPPAPQEDPEN